MNSKINILFCYFAFIAMSFHLTSSRKLIQIQTVTRHGERTPIFTYPLDPYKNAWERGLGQLTNKGIDQLKEVGGFLRNSYHDFLPKTFHSVI